MVLKRAGLKPTDCLAGFCRSNKDAHLDEPIEPILLRSSMDSTAQPVWMSNKD